MADVGVKSGAQDYLEVIENNSDDIDNALEIIGQIAVGKVQQYMTDLRPTKRTQHNSKERIVKPADRHWRITSKRHLLNQNTKPKEGLG